MNTIVIGNAPKVLILPAIALALALLPGCSAGGGDAQQQPQQPPAAGQEATDSSADPEIAYGQIDWSVGKHMEDGHRRVSLSYTNNSPYRVLSLRADFKVKEDVDDGEMKRAFKSMTALKNAAKLAKQHGAWCEASAPVEPCGKSDPAALEVGITYLTDVSQYELMEADTMTVEFLGDDAMIYTETIDCSDGTVDVDSDAADSTQWSDSKLVSLVPRPDGMLIEEIRDYEGQFAFDALDVTREEYKAYVAQCRKMGFTKEVAKTDTTYYATSKDGKYDLSLFYDPNSMKLDEILNKN